MTVTCRDSRTKNWPGCLIFLAAWALLPVRSFAQGGVDVGVSAVGLVAIQPVDGTYVGAGGPYLDRGLGGLAPGLGAGVSVIAPGGFSVIGEFNWARFSVEQKGRLVGGCYVTEVCHTNTTTWHTSMLSGLIGYATSSLPTRVVLLGGVSKNFGVPEIDGVPREIDESETPKVVFTGGLDVVHTSHASRALLISGRYSYVARDSSLQQLGVGTHVFRIGVGIRWRVNK